MHESTQPELNSPAVVEVDDLGAIEAALRGIDYIIPKRQTFYGATEVIVREPAGHIVAFAQMNTQP